MNRRYYDSVRGTIALARLGNALGVRLDADKPDHELLELLALAAEGIHDRMYKFLRDQQPQPIQGKKK